MQWYEKGEYTPYGQVFDIGNSTLDAIKRIKSGISPEKAGGETEYDNGNGSLMRILPLAFYLYHETDIEKRVKIIYEISSLTHRHIRSKVACHIYVEIAIKLINGENILDEYKEVCSMLNEYYEEKLESKEKVIFKRILDGEIYKYSVDEIKSSGYVIHTLEAALWCLLTTNTYKDSVLKAVNLGDDTDTTGAVTGGLAGILYGLDSIPKEWIEDLGKGIMIFNSANQLYKKCFNIK